jgi:hypothetical protein
MNTETHTARMFIEQLSSLASPEEREKRRRHFSGDDEKTQFLGVRMGDIFKLAKEFINMPLDEIEELLDNPF